MSARLCAVMKRAHLQLSDRAARTESTGSSVPPGLKESWYRDVFIFLVPTWYRSTGSFDNPNLDGYPMPQIHDILESVHGATVFSTFDLKSGYWQVEMESESIHKTAFVTQSGLYEFLRLPFGLKNSAASFQRLMEFVLKDLKGNMCFVYIDDIVVYSKTEKEHLNHLKEVLQCLSKAGLTLNLQKCNLIFEVSWTRDFSRGNKDRPRQG